MQTQSLIRKGEFAKASRYRLSTSSPMVNKEAIQNVENIVKTDPGHALNTMLYTDKNSSILFAQDQVSGEREVLASYPGNPNLETPTMEDVSFNIEDNALITEAQRLDYRAQATAKAVEKFGTESISNPNNEFYSSAQQLVEKETSDMINNHISRVDSLRKSTGSSSITINAVSYTHLTLPTNSRV